MYKFFIFVPSTIVFILWIKAMNTSIKRIEKMAANHNRAKIKTKALDIVGHDRRMRIEKGN